MSYRVKHERDTVHGEGWVVYFGDEATAWCRTLAEALETAALVALADREEAPK